MRPSNGASLDGLVLFICGPLGLLELCPAWYANVTLGIAFWAMFRKKFLLARIMAGLTVLLALTSFLPKSFYTNGSTSQIVRYGIGFYLWLGACRLPFLLLELTSLRRPTQPPSLPEKPLQNAP